MQNEETCFTWPLRATGPAGPCARSVSQGVTRTSCGSRSRRIEQLVKPVERTSAFAPDRSEFLEDPDDLRAFAL